ncbi:MAG: hypothetical protein WD058_04660 [Dehalococcoidia bacterium]
MIPARGAGYALFGLAGLLLAVAVASGWHGVARLVGREVETTAVQTVAVSFVAAAGTYDFADAGSYAHRLEPFAVGELRDVLAPAVLAPAVLDPTVRTQRRSVATEVESASVTSLSDEAAVAIVTAVQSRRWFDAASGRETEQHVRQRTSCRLVHEDGRWLVAEIRLLSEEPARLDQAR